MELRIRRATLEAMERHAVETYPEECCGLVLGDEAGGEETRRIANIQNRMHERDPEQYPRDARIAYFMEPAELGAALREVEEGGRVLRLFYHSHPDHGAYFSAEDKAAATPFGEPSYPEARYLVISVKDGKVADRLVVAWNPANEDFTGIPLVVEE